MGQNLRQEDQEGVLVIGKKSPSALQREAREFLWRDGDLRWKLDSHQKRLQQLFYGSNSGRFILELARRVGKTFLCVVISIETCLRTPKSRVVYGAPTIKEVSEFIIPIVEKVCEDAPSDCCPIYNGQAGHYVFPNGSSLVLFGCDDKRKANRGRGPGADLVVVDEAGFIPILRYVLKSVLRPQTLTTAGKTLLASTPSDEPDHDFTLLCEQAQAVGALAHASIYDNPRLTSEQIQNYIEQDAKDEGMTVDEYVKTDTFKREYLAERITDKTLTVCPEWAELSSTYFSEIERPQFFDSYVSMDMGGVDPHGVLFGYWHFANSQLVIEDELLLREGQNTEQLAQAIKEKEAQLWGVERWAGTLRGAKETEHLPEWLRESLLGNAPAQPYLRICDNDVQMARDLQQLNKITFIPTAKNDKWLQVNEMRILMREGRLLIHPRCRNLDRHLRQTIWSNERRTDYKRKNGEHGDLLDCLVYMVRNIRKHRNPTPESFGRTEESHIVRPKQNNVLAKAFGLR